MTDTTTDFPPVPDLVWSDSLHSGDARMDQTHEEFVDMVAQLRATEPDVQLPLFRALIDHTVEHFGQEDRWMVAIGFAADNCHASQHQSILETMRSVEEHFLKGDREIITRMAEALAEWFPMHARTMDAGLVQHMQTVGFDSQTETLADPSKVRPASMSGCGSVTCS